MRIADQPIYSRPYEKFEKYGAHSLTDVELLAILIRVGTASMNAMMLAEKLLCQDKATPSLLSLHDLSLEDLKAIKGIGRVKSIQILALLELSRRMAKSTHLEHKSISSPDDIARYFMEDLRHEKEEHFVVVLLNTKNKMIATEKISKGSLTASIVHPREAYKPAIKKSAHSIIALHNHPSGDPSPSREDVQITRRLKEVGELLGIPLLDHIIIGDGSYRSLKECGYL